MKRLIFILMYMWGISSFAQDVILKKDNSTIVAKVLEVSQETIKYKKFSNLEGPTYSINVTDVSSINYENGDRDNFDTIDSKVLAAEGQEKAGGVVHIKPEDLSAEARVENDALIAEINSPIEMIFDDKDKKGEKKANYANACLGVKSNSVLTNEDIEISMVLGSLTKPKKSAAAVWNEKGSWMGHDPAIKFQIRNKTDQTLYLDLGNTFFITMRQPTCYYVPSSTTTSHSASTGGSVNLGTVTSALGVGGAVSTLANGVNVGGTSSNMTTNTTYSQRIIAIPPMSTIGLTTQYLFGNVCMDITKGCKYDYSISNYSYIFCPYINFSKKSSEGQMMYGDHYCYSEDSSPIQMSFVVAYSKVENCVNGKSLSVNLYLKDLLGMYEGIVSKGKVNRNNYLYFRVKVENNVGDSFPRE